MQTERAALLNAVPLTAPLQHSITNLRDDIVAPVTTPHCANSHLARSTHHTHISDTNTPTHAIPVSPITASDGEPGLHVVPLSATRGIADGS